MVKKLLDMLIVLEVAVSIVLLLIHAINNHFSNHLKGGHFKVNEPCNGINDAKNTAIICNAPRLLTIKEAAMHLGLTTWAMRERIWAGHIPAVRFPGGRKAYIDVLDIDAFINQNKRPIN